MMLKKMSYWLDGTYRFRIEFSFSGIHEEIYNIMKRLLNDPWMLFYRNQRSDSIKVNLCLNQNFRSVRFSV